MSKQGQGQGHGEHQKPEIGKKKGQSRNASREAQRARQFNRDKLRHGTAWEVEQQFEDDMPEGQGADEHLIEALDEDNLPEDQLPQSLSEIPLADEDDVDDSEDQFSAPASESIDTPIEVLHWENAVITVIGNRAIFQVPDWARGFEHTDLDARWETYAQMADWLNRERPAFLRQPGFLALAGGSIDLNPPLPVSQEGLYQRLGLTCDQTTFGKHARSCLLVWPNRRIGLDALYAYDAKLAWCAQAAIQRQRQRGYIARDGELGRADIQPPRARDERATIYNQARNGWNLSPILFVNLLCVLTGCKWADVLAVYGDQIFYKG